MPPHGKLPHLLAQPWGPERIEAIVTQPHFASGLDVSAGVMQLAGRKEVPFGYWYAAVSSPPLNLGSIVRNCTPAKGHDPKLSNYYVRAPFKEFRNDLCSLFLS